MNNNNNIGNVINNLWQDWTRYFINKKEFQHNQDFRERLAVFLECVAPPRPQQSSSSSSPDTNANVYSIKIPTQFQFSCPYKNVSYNDFKLETIWNSAGPMNHIAWNNIHIPRIVYTMKLIVTFQGDNGPYMISTCGKIYDDEQFQIRYGLYSDFSARKVGKYYFVPEMVKLK